MQTDAQRFAHDRWREIKPDVVGLLSETIRLIGEYDGEKPILSVDSIDEAKTAVNHRARYDRMLKSEEAFSLRFWQAVFGHMATGHPLTLLLDIDHTVASRKYRESDDANASLLRPAAIPLLRQATSYYPLSNGIITSRSFQDIESNLGDPAHLLALEPYITRSHIIASDHPIIDISVSTTGATVTLEEFEQFRGVLASPHRYYESFRAFRKAGGEPLPRIDIVKLMQLAELQGAGTNYLVFDDQAYAGLLLNNSGVSLEFHEQAQY